MTFRVCLAQINPVLGDVARNLAEHRRQIAAARALHADMVIFPELSLTGYHLRDLVPEVALTREGEEIQALAAEATDLSIVFGFVEERADFRFQVAAAYCESGAVKHIHRKVYLPTYGMFDEERYLTRGDSVRAFDTRLGRFGMLVCEDIWHPSTPHILAHDGAVVMITISNSPGRGVGGPELDTAVAYRGLNQVYARLFGIYTVFVNRVGYEEGVSFWGGSTVTDPFGQTQFEAPILEPGLFTVDLDLRAVRRARAASPMLQDERLDVTIHELERIRHERYADRG